MGAELQQLKRPASAGGGAPRSGAKAYVDFNQLFVAVNCGLFITMFAFYSVVGLPPLVNLTTLALYAVLFVQVQIILYYERRIRDPFLIVLVFTLTLFYFPRILTLFWNDVFFPNTVLARLRPATVTDINHTLLFIFFANIAIFLGLTSARQLVKRIPARQPARDSINIKTVLVLLPVAVFYNFYTVFINPVIVASAQRGLRLLGLFQNPTAFIPLGIIYMQGHSEGTPLFGRFVLRKRYLYGIAFLATISAAILLNLVIGSRSALLSVLQIAFFTALALGHLKLPRKALIIALTIIVLSVPMFTIATYSRMIRLSLGADVTLKDQRGQLLEGVWTLFGGQGIVRLLVPVFERTGYLDYSVDLIKNRREYSEVINVPYYLKSVVDNSTPGFDVFGVARASNALNHAYDAAPLVRFAETYNSDQFDNYGEYYVLLGGWLSLGAFFFTAFCFQSVYLRIRGRSALSAAVWRYFAISIFFSWMCSFGMDWLILDITRGIGVWFVLLLFVDRTPYFKLA